MIHVQVDDFFLLTRLPLPLLATADSSKPAQAAIILEHDQWMKGRTTKSGPNDARSVVWALGEFFSHFFIFFLAH